MGSPCEVLCESESAEEAEALANLAASEAWRIEDKLSRYIRGNIIDQINSANGEPVNVDAETGQMLDFAAKLHELSDGAFDITSGVLRRAWTFDGGDHIPDQKTIEELLALVGWEKLDWVSPILSMPTSMEIDLGGIGKEYAVDRAVQILKAAATTPCLVNFGGDLAVTCSPNRRDAWTVGIESANPERPVKIVELRQGALATSGDARRFLICDGVRYSHVLDPRTGWPVKNAATSITVAADTCTQAGMLSTLAMLKGSHAEAFLASQDEKHWCWR